MNRTFNGFYNKILFNKMKMNSLEMEKCLNNKTYQQIIYFSSFRSTYLMTKYLLKLNNKDINDRNFMTEVRKEQKNDSNDGHNQFKSRRTHRILSGIKNRTHYDTLGINSNATQKEIKSAYYEKSKLCHPDINQSSDAEQEFRQITDAYEVLANKKYKKAYDFNISPNNHERRDASHENMDSNNNNYWNYNTDDNEDYTQFWKNRRKQHEKRYHHNYSYKSNDYKQYNDSNSQSNESKESKQTYRGEDPLNYEPKDFFKNYFTEEMAKEYEEQIRQRDELFKKEMENLKADGSVSLMFISTILAVFGVFQLLNYYFELDKPVVKDDKTDKNTKN